MESINILRISMVTLIKDSFFCVVAAFFALLCVVGFSNVTHAQEIGVSISPATIEESLDPGENAQYQVTVENLNNSEQTYYLYKRNISGVRAGGVPVFAENDDEVTGYEIVDWITLPTNQLIIPARGKETLQFTLNVPQDATPGSHFGGIFISVDPPEIQNSGAAVGYQVANIVSIRVSGDIVEKASIRQFSTSKFLYGAQNVDFTARIENTGNVLIRPTGPLEIFNMLGNKVGTVTFNEERSAVFPNSEREYQINWTGNSVGFGRYEAILSPVYGEDGAIQTMSNTVSFWILPLNIIGPAVGVLAVILIVTFVMIKLYIKRSLAHLNQGRRVINKRRKANSSSLLLLTVVMLTVTALFLIVLLALFA